MRSTTHFRYSQIRENKQIKVYNNAPICIPTIDLSTYVTIYESLAMETHFTWMMTINLNLTKSLSPNQIDNQQAAGSRKIIFGARRELRIHPGQDFSCGWGSKETLSTFRLTLKLIQIFMNYATDSSMFGAFDRSSFRSIYPTERLIWVKMDREHSYSFSILFVSHSRTK